MKYWKVFIHWLWCCTAGNFQLTMQIKRRRKLTAQWLRSTLQCLTKLTSQHDFAVCFGFLVGWLNLLLMLLCGDKCLKIDFISLVQCGGVSDATSCHEHQQDCGTPDLKKKKKTLKPLLKLFSRGSPQKQLLLCYLVSNGLSSCSRPGLDALLDFLEILDCFDIFS